MSSKASSRNASRNSKGRSKKGPQKKKQFNKKLLIAAAAALAVIAGLVILLICTSGSSDSGKGSVAVIEIENYGTVKVELNRDTAPITVDNFINLANQGFYNGLTFHRIFPGFVLQGGDPSGDGSGGSGTAIKGEFSANGVENNISHTRGTISMARRGNDNDSATSQFFIVLSDDYTSTLDGSYAAFGHVIEGMDVVDRVVQDATPYILDSNGTVGPENQPKITSITIE